MNLKSIASSFRRGLLNGRESDLMCFAVCWPLQAYLSALGQPSKLVHGSVMGADHCWLLLPDGRILDPTADQFNGPLIKMPKVYIGPKPEKYAT